MLNCYSQRIQFLRTCVDQLLQRIQSLEIGMNRRKQQNQQPHKDEITMLKLWTKKLLYFLAEINNCQYFQKYQFNFNFNDYINAKIYFKAKSKKYKLYY